MVLYYNNISKINFVYCFHFLYRVFGHYVLDNVALCAFGVDANCQRNPDDPFLKHSKNLTEGSPTSFSRILRGRYQ